MKKRFIYLSVCVCVVFLCSCTSGQNNPGGTSGTSGNASASPALNVEFDDKDYNTEYTEADACRIIFSETGAEILGEGASAEGYVITISQEGDYVLSGSVSDGRLIVDAKNCDVHLIFDGLSIACADSAPIYIKKSNKTVITLKEGTQNYIRDCESYQYDDEEKEEPNAAVFSKSDLTINGNGSLRVTALFNDGITSKDTLKITGGSIQVQAADDGIMGRDCLAVDGGSIEIECSGDGLKSTNDEESNQGNIVLSGGDISIVSEKDGVQAENALKISGGKYNIKAGGGSAENSGYSNSWTDEDSAKGIKAQKDLSITGGIMEIDSADDALHSNGALNISGGSLKLSTGDDGAHADGALLIAGGSIDILQSYEGLEGLNVTIKGGDIRIKAADDGINSAGGTDSGGMRPGDHFDSSRNNGDVFIRVEGGMVYIDASGDGIDGNGNIYMTGGTMLVNGPADGGNGALDYEGTFEMSGGLLIAAGSSAMALNISQGSGQCGVMANFTSVQNAGTVVALTDADNNPIAVFAPAKQFQSVVISAPGVQKGDECNIYTGSTAETDQYGLAQEISSLGVLEYQFTFTDIAVSLGTGGNMGGGLRPGEQPGGMRPPGRG